MTTATATAPLRPLMGFEPETVGGVRIFTGIQARGTEVMEWAREHPGALEGSKWMDCDLDGTEWSGALRDMKLVDCSLRNSVWRFENAENIRLMGSKRIPMHVDARSEWVVASLDGIRARVDGMKMTGSVLALSLFRVAGSNVELGEPGAGFFDQETVPVQYSGTPFRMDNGSVQHSYLYDLTVYLDAEDVSFHRNGLPNMYFGGKARRCDLSWNLVPSGQEAA